MEKKLILIILIVFCLIPISNAYSQDDKLREISQIPFEPFLVNIEDSEDPQASAYLKIRNSDNQLVGIVPVNAGTYLDHPILPYYLETIESVNTVTVEEQVFEMKKIRPMDLVMNEKDCDYDRPFSPCFSYSFRTSMKIIYLVDGNEYVKEAFSGLTHGYISEERDTIETSWTILYPKN
jgi:hypothetical protein